MPGSAVEGTCECFGRLSCAAGVLCIELIRSGFVVSILRMPRWFLRNANALGLFDFYTIPALVTVEVSLAQVLFEVP